MLNRTFTFIAGVVILVMVSATGGAVAGSMITSRQIENGTVRSVDIKNGTLRLHDLHPDLRSYLRTMRLDLNEEQLISDAHEDELDLLR